MHKTARNTERGQALVIIVVAMVVLLGFTALAVDGSMVYSDRRHAQSASDSSSLAGGTRLAQDLEANGLTNADLAGVSTNCSNVRHLSTITSNSRQAARKRAGDNDFTTFNANMSSTELANNGTGAITTCGKDSVLGVLENGQSTVLFDQYFIDLETQITDKTETAFAHFVYQDELKNTVSAVTRVYLRQPLAYGYAIVALNKSTSNCNSNQSGMHFGGNGTVNVLDGGIFSNGCMDVDGNSTDVNLVSSGYSGKSLLSAYYFATANNNSLDKIDFGAADHDEFLRSRAFDEITGSTLRLKNQDSNRIPLSSYDIPMPDCSDHEVDSDYITGWWDSRGTHLPAGLYCVTDKLDIKASDTVKGRGVTIVLLNGMHINGSADVDLQARYSNESAINDNIGGLLFYQPRNVTADIIVNGNSRMTLRGSWVAPGASVTFDGNSDYRIFGQVIGYNVEFRGSSVILVEYRQNKVVSRPARLELNR